MKADDLDDAVLPVNSPERQRVLDVLELLTEGDLCLLYDCGRKALQNRPRAELPPFFRAGGKRLWFRDDVVKFFRTRTND